jgi:hypothetical protein
MGQANYGTGAATNLFAPRDSVRNRAQIAAQEMCYRSLSKQFKRGKMAERPVLVGLVPQAVVLESGDQVSWISDAGNLKVEFDVNRCPFGSNVFQAPAGMRLLSGPVRTGTKVGGYKYKVWLNEQMIGHGEVLVRGA